MRVRGCIDDNDDGSQSELYLIQDLYANNAAPLQQIIIQCREHTPTENGNPLTQQIDDCACVRVILSVNLMRYRN